MKKTYLKIFSFLFLTILLVAGCQKEIKDQTPAVTKSEGELQARGSHGNDKDGCRLVSNISEFGMRTYTYNKRGLVDQENFDFIENGKLKFQYDARGRLIKSGYYSGDVLLNTIVFFYQGDRLVREIWYDGNTQIKVDEVFHFYNGNGRVWKSASILGDYISLYRYTPDGGSVKGWKFYVGGKLNYEQEFSYLPPHHRNPSLARPGLVYDFISANGWWGQGQWYSTSEKDISYDENGENPVLLLDQDPRESIVSFNARNYVTATDFFDVLTREYVHFRFDYDKCGHDDRDKPVAAQRLTPVGDRKISPNKWLMKGSGKSMKEQVIELRKHLETR
ncbi:MAG: hypothetical protein ABI675_24475 [Chitinophagaceae bacterium]